MAGSVSIEDRTKDHLNKDGTPKLDKTGKAMKPRNKPWFCVVRDGRGGRKGVSFKLKKDAERFERETENAMADQKFNLDIIRINLTVRELVAESLKKQGECKDTSIATYTKMAKHINRHPIADMNIVAVTAHEVELFLEDLTFLRDTSKKLCKGSKELVLAVLDRAFEQAVARKLLLRSPTDRMKEKIVLTNEERLKQQEKCRVLSMAQMDELLDWIMDRYGLRAFAFYLVIARTGCRISESIALMWDCVNFQTKVITIKRNISKNKEGLDELSTTKGHATRDLKMTVELERVLLRLKEVSGGTVNDFVIQSRTGKFMVRDATMEQWWNPMAEALCAKWNTEMLAADQKPIGRITPHILRHTVASQLLAIGKTMKQVQKTLGHASEQTTSDLYSHLVPEQLTENPLDCLDTDQRVSKQPRSNTLTFPVAVPDANSMAHNKKRSRNTA